MKNDYGTIKDKNDPNYGRTRTSVWSRSMGFIRPIENFNIGKRSEFEERKTFRENIIFSTIAKLLKKEKTDGSKKQKRN